MYGFIEFLYHYTFILVSMLFPNPNCRNPEVFNVNPLCKEKKEILNALKDPPDLALVMQVSLLVKLPIIALIYFVVRIIINMLELFDRRAKEVKNRKRKARLLIRRAIYSKEHNMSFEEVLSKTRNL